MGAVSRLLGLGPRRWALLLRVAGTAVLVEPAVRVLPLATTARLAGAHLVLDDSVAARDAWPLLTPAERERADLALRLLARRPFRATCLRRALVLASLLRRRSPGLRVGVAKTDGVVAAHAWLEIDGASLDPEAAAYRGLAPVVRHHGRGRELHRPRDAHGGQVGGAAVGPLS